MSRLLDRLLGGGSSEGRGISSVDDFAAALGAMQGAQYLYPMTDGGQPRERGGSAFTSHASGVYKQGGVVFSIAAVRMLLFSEARFAWQVRRNGRPQELFTNRALAPLERPWRNGSTADLLARMDQDVVLAGNAYVVGTATGLRRLRPDWVDVLVGTNGGGPDAIDAEVIGYLYWPGGEHKADRPVALSPEDVAHFAPYPDPERHYVGMSPLQPIVLEAVSHRLAQRHKIKFYEHAATPNLVFTMDPSITPEKFEKFKALVEEGHAGVSNAYKNLFLGGGADVTVVGADFAQLDFKVTQGHSETLVAAALGVHPVIVGLSEGMQGSALNAGNYSQARRRFADGTMRPLWRGAADALSSILDVPAGASLVPDVRDVSFLQEDAADAASIFASLAASGRQLTDGGFVPDSVIAALDTLDVTKLKHTGLLPVQVQEPGTGDDAAPTAPQEAPHGDE